MKRILVLMLFFASALIAQTGDRSPGTFSLPILVKSASGLPGTAITQATSGDPVVLRGASPYWILTSTGLNLDISTEAQASDTSAFWMRYTSVTKKPLFKITGITGNVLMNIDSAGYMGFGTLATAGYEFHVKATGSNNADFKLETGGGTVFEINQANGGGATMRSEGSYTFQAGSSITLSPSNAASAIFDRSVGRGRFTLGTAAGTGAGKAYPGDSTFVANLFAISGTNGWNVKVGTDQRLEFYYGPLAGAMTVRAAIDTAGAYNDLYP